MTPYAFDFYITQPDAYKFSDGSDIGRAPKGSSNESNYRFFEIQPIKWIVLNYNYLPSQYSTGGDGTHTRLELLSNNVLVGGVAADNILWQDNTINTYLNVTFNQEAFKSENTSIQATSTIYNNVGSSDINLNSTGSNNNYLDVGFNSTTQKLYLLSYHEVVNTTGPYAGSNKVFRNADDRVVTSSDYAKAHNLYLETLSGSDEPVAYWWLRTTDGSIVYRIGNSGIISGAVYSDTNKGTRPAMQRGQECPLC